MSCLPGSSSLFNPRYSLLSRCYLHMYSHVFRDTVTNRHDPQKTCLPRHCNIPISPFALATRKFTDNLNSFSNLRVGWAFLQATLLFTLFLFLFNFYKSCFKKKNKKKNTSPVTHTWPQTLWNALVVRSTIMLPAHPPPHQPPCAHVIMCPLSLLLLVQPPTPSSMTDPGKTVMTGNR